MIIEITLSHENLHKLADHLFTHSTAIKLNKQIEYKPLEMAIGEDYIMWEFRPVEGSSKGMIFRGKLGVNEKLQREGLDDNEKRFKEELKHVDINPANFPAKYVMTKL